MRGYDGGAETRAFNALTEGRGAGVHETVI